MATIDSPSRQSVSAEVDPAHNALRVTPRPLEYVYQGKPQGHYRAALLIANGPGSSANMFGLRWTDPVNFAVLVRTRLSFFATGGWTAQRVDPIQMFGVRNYTADETTNATFTTFGAGQQAMRSATMGPSKMKLINMSANAGFSGGTRSIDPNAMGATHLPQINTSAASQPFNVDIYRWDQLGMHPWVLTQNEGLFVQWGTTALASGTIYISCTFEWAEVASF